MNANMPLRVLLLSSLLLACVILSASWGENVNFVVNPATVCSCESPRGQCFVVAENWKNTTKDLLEVSARDFTNGESIGKWCQGESEKWVAEVQFFDFNSWQPVDGSKRNMVATLDYFNWNYGDDDDWNLHIIPTPEFSFLITDVEILHPESVDEHLGCGPPFSCMEAEISPDQHFWTNPWFYLPNAHFQDIHGNGFSWLEGRQMGFYGPWIMDANHDYKSEIHPVEMMWFRDHHTGGLPSSPSYDVFWLFFMQDNTGRFDDRDNFDCDGEAPVGWRPWADSPLSGQFNIAFEVDPQQEVANFFIKEFAQWFVMTSQDSNAREDADDGRSHALEINGRVVVRVEEEQPNDDDLGVTFTNVCMGADRKLRGFVSIRSKIGGDDDRDEEGFHILYVTRSLASTRPDVTNPVIGDLPHVLVTSKEVGGSLKGKDNHFTGDLQLILHGSEAATDPDYIISKIEFAGGDIQRELRFEQKQAKEVLVRDLPLISGGKLTITSSSGHILRLHTPTLAPVPGIEETVTRSAIDAVAGGFLSASVGGIPGASLPKDKKLSLLQELQLKFKPRYAPYEGNDTITDRPSPFASEINQAIKKNQQKRLEELFNSAEPFTLKWTFEATNLATGRPVSVYTDKSDSEGVQIELMSVDLANDTLKVRFPFSGSGIIELFAKASVTDTKGKTTVVEHRVWSHGFHSTGKSVDKWFPLIQALSGVKDRSVLIVSEPNRKPRDFSLIPDARARRAHIVNAYVRQALRDRQVTIGELRSIILTLKRFSVQGLTR